MSEIQTIVAAHGCTVEFSPTVLPDGHRPTSDILEPSLLFSLYCTSTWVFSSLFHVEVRAVLVMIESKEHHTGTGRRHWAIQTTQTWQVLKFSIRHFGEALIRVV